MICRIDDFPSGIRPINDLPYFYKILEEFEKREMIVYLGIVPFTYDKFCSTNPLAKYKNIIPCMHGYTHKYEYYSKILIELGDPKNTKTIGTFDEFESFTYENIFTQLSNGKAILKKYFPNALIDTYIPPCNLLNQLTVKVLEALNFKIILCDGDCKEKLKEKINLEIIRSNSLGRINEINFNVDQPVICLHITWEADLIQKIGWDEWLILLDKLSAKYHNKYKIEEKPIITIEPIQITKQILKQPITLFLNYYIDINPLRQSELKLCLTKNIENQHIDKIILIHKEGDIPPKNDKILPILVKNKPTYTELFNIANKYEGIKIIANSDIFFNETIIHAKKIKENQIFALCRWELTNDYKLQFYNDIIQIKNSSQDVWIYQGKIENVNVRYGLGIPGCDNAIAYELDKAGYEVLSPSLSIKAIHYHYTKIRNYQDENENNKFEIQDAKKYIEISDLEEPVRQKIVFFTSISPNEKFLERQKNAIKSWLHHKIKVYSVNSINEIKILKPNYPDVTFIEKTTESIFGESYVKINNILSIANKLQSEVICLINADNELIKDINAIKLFTKMAEKGLVIVSKYDYSHGGRECALLNKCGFDIMAFNQKHIIDILPESNLSFGQPAWDYWFPYHFINKGIKVFWIKQPFIFHEKHHYNYPDKNWAICVEMFKKEIGKQNEENNVFCREILKYIQDNAIVLDIQKPLSSDIFKDGIKDPEIIETKHFNYEEIKELLKDIENPILFELGANTGYDTINFAKIPNITIHTFECDPRNKLDHLPDNVIKNYKAISDKDGFEILTLSDKYNGNPDWTESSSIKVPKNHLKKYPYVTFGNKIQVPCVTLDSYCKKNDIVHIDFIWADVQGAEENMILGGEKILRNTKYLYTEFSNDEMYEGQININKIFELLPYFSLVDFFGNNVLLKNDFAKKSNENFIMGKKPQPKIIPCIANFFWNDETPMSYLRFLTLQTFKKLHPNWEINLYIGKSKTKKTWIHFEQQDFMFENTDINYIYKVIDLKINIIRYHSEYNLNPNYMSDIFRWDILKDKGGWYFDLDQIFLKSFDDLLIYDFVYGGTPNIYAGVIGLSYNSQIAKYIADIQAEIIKKGIDTYCQIGNAMLSNIIRTDKNFLKPIMNKKIYHAENHLFYPIYESQNTFKIYKGEIDFELLKNNGTYTVHWYAGHPISQEFNKKYTESFAKTSKDSISKYINSNSI